MQKSGLMNYIRKNSLILMIVFGFASFKTAQTTLYSTAVFMTEHSFIMISGMEFSLLAAVAVMLMEVIVVVAAFSGKLRPYSMPVVVPTLISIVACVCSFWGILATLPIPISLGILALVHGVVTVVLTLAWVEMFFRLEATDAVKSLATAILISSVVSLLLQGRGLAIALVATVVLLVASAALCCCARRKITAESTSGVLVVKEKIAKHQKLSVKKHLRGLVAIGEGLVSLLVLGCAVGIINGFLAREGTGFEGSSEASALGTCIASIIFFIAVFSLPRIFSASKAYRVLFPVMTGLLILWPLVDFQYGYFFSIAFVAGHGFISTCVMYLIINEGSRKLLNSYAFMGAAVFLIRLSSMTGLTVGASIALIDAATSFKTMLVVAVVIYLLSLVLLFMLRRKHLDSSTNNAMSDEETFAQKADVLSARYHLTQRESDILRHLSRGRTATYIGQTLYLSPNTVRGYIKSIYIKLDVHSKQELIDLFS